MSRSLYRLRRAVVGAVYDLGRNHTLVMAAGLSYYFLFSMFPLFIVLAAALAFVPVPNLFDEILNLMARFVPEESMALVRDIVASVLTTRRGDLLSLGLVFTLWFATTGFVAMIEGLNMSYDVHEGRPFWKTRLIALLLASIIGTMMIATLVLLMLGPRFGEWLTHTLHLAPPIFAEIWPYLRWGIMLTFFVLAVEMIYYLGPNVKQKFICTAPGAILAVLMWVGASYGFNLYLRDFADYNATYGVLGAAIALMFWLYLTSFSILMGAEINAELLKSAGERLAKKEEVDPEDLRDPRADMPLDAEAEQHLREVREAQEEKREEDERAA